MYTRAKRLAKALSICTGTVDEDRCAGCPFYGHEYNCVHEMMSRAKNYIENKSDPYEPTPDYTSDYDEFLCGNCGRKVIPSYRCCPRCGEEIDWQHAIGYEYKEFKDALEELDDDYTGDESFD